MAQGNEPKLEVELFTWGSCKHGSASIIWPRVLDLVRVTGSPGRHVVELEEAVIEYENHDSRRNIHRRVFIRAKRPIIVRHYGSGSCNPNSAFDYIYLVTPDSVTELDVQEGSASFEEYGGREVVTYLVRYVTAPGGGRVVLDRVQVLERRVNYDRLQIRVHVDGENAIVNGDTYYVKDVLRKYGFKWDGGRRAWVGGVGNVTGILNEVRALGIRVEQS